jgi:predicted GNAT superfamily acetyltransferase
MEDNGGLLLGAFEDERLVGFCLGFLGREDDRLFHYSHMTAVRPEVQNQHLGFRLKVYQREEVLKQRLSEIRWTYDPLQSRNAFLNVRRLGARPEVYHIRYYGTMGSEINRGLETDRLRVSWALTSAMVQERIDGRYPTPEQDRARVGESQPLVLTEPHPSGVRTPASAAEPSQPTVQIEVPIELARVRELAPDAVPLWREATRRAFRSSLGAGYRVDDFAVITRGAERRGYYLLSLPPHVGRDRAPSAG